MIRPIDRAVLCVTLAALAAAGQMAFAADADNGLRLAERWCAACHVVSSKQSKGADNVPSFAAVAQRPGFSAERLAFFLLDPHPVMPNMSLSRSEAQDIAAYIARLRR